MKASEIKPGMVVWVPCEVRSGPFPNERRVLIKTEITEWFGFVNTSELENKILQGHDRVRGIVAEVKPSYVVIAVRGQSPSSGEIQAPPSFISGSVALQA
jgi:hypothetical protein